MHVTSRCNDPAPAARAALPLVLLPGTLCDARLFAPLLARLDLGERAVMHVDFDGTRSIDEAVAQLLATVPPRVILLGFSLGGIVALALARVAPDRVAGLVLVGSTPHPVDPFTHAARRAEVARARAEGISALTRAMLVPRYLANPADVRNAALIVAMATTAGPKRFADQTELALSRSDALLWLPELAMPVLVAGGSLDGINPPSVQIKIAEALPDAELALIEGAGHFTPLEHPDILAAHVTAWLARIDEREASQIKETQR